MSSTAPERSQPGRQRLRRAATSTAMGTLFIAAVLLGVVLHLDTPVSRRVAARLANAALAATFAGRVEVDAIAALGLRSLEIRRVSVATADGEPVLEARAIRVRALAVRQLGRLLLAEGPTHVRLGDIHIDEATLRLEPGPSGELTVVEAFQLLEPSPTEPDEPAAPVQVIMPRIEIGRATVRGTLPVSDATTQPLDLVLARLQGSVRVGPDELVIVKVKRTGLVEQALLGLPLAGSVNAHVKTQPLRAWGDFAGHVGPLEMLARARIDDGELAVTATLPRVDPRALDELLPGQPLEVPFVGQLSVTGTPPIFAITARAAFPRFDETAVRGDLRLAGQLSAASVPTFDLQATLTDLDSRIVGIAELPVRVSGRARARGRLAGADSEVRVAVSAGGIELDGTPLPTVAGTLLVDPQQVLGRLRLAESPATADLALRYAAATGLEVAARTELAAIESVPRLRHALATRLGVRGLRGRAHLRGRARWQGGELDADFEAGLERIRWPARDLAVADARVAGRLLGPPQQLQLRAAARGRDLRLLDHGIAQFDVTARGPVEAPTVEASAADADGRRLQAKATVAAAAGELRGVTLRLRRGDTSVRGRLRRVALRGGAVALDGLAIEGLSDETVEGSLRVDRGELVGRMQARSVDLDALRRLLGLRFPLRGRLSVDIDLQRTDEGRVGHAKLVLRDGGMLVLSGLQADLEAHFEGERVAPSARLALTMPGAEPSTPAKGPPDRQGCGGTIATISLEDAEGHLAGPLLEPDTYRDLVGRATVRASGVRLSCLSQVAAMALYPTSPFPLRQATGLVDASAHIERRSPTELPSLSDVQLKTSGLVLETRPQGDDERGAFLTDRLDLDLAGSFDGRSGSTVLRVRLLDPTPLVDVGAQLTIDLGRARQAGGSLVDALLDSPLSLRAALPRSTMERLAALPMPVRTELPPLTGQVQLDAHLEGTLREPYAAVRLRGYDVAYRPAPEPPSGLPASPRAAPGGSRPLVGGPPAPPEADWEAEREADWVVPIDVDVLASYGAERFALDGRIGYRGKPVANLTGSARGPLPSPWGNPAASWRDLRGAVTLRLDALPLSALPPLAEGGVQGALSGTVSIADLGGTPKPRGALRIDGLAVGETALFEAAELALRPAETPDGATVVADASLRARSGGGLHAIAYAGVDWTDGWLPEIAMQRPADLFVRAQRFPLEVLHPLTGRSISKLQGSLAGDLRLQWQQIAAADDVQLTVDMRVADGVLHVPQFGQELHDLEAHILTLPGGLLKLADVSAAATTGRASGWATARLDGLSFVDLSGQLAVEEGEEIPLTVEGVPLGQARGRLLLQATRQPDRINLIVTAVNVHLALPSSPTASVQSLPSHPDIELSHPLGPTEPPPQPDDLSWQVTAALRSTEIEGNGLRIVLSSAADDPPQLVFGRETEVGGELVLEGGEFDLLGLGGGIKLFELERGLVRLRTAEPDNPYVNVLASYRAPDGSIIYVEYAGTLLPITRDKIRFSSSPPRSQEEILAVLLFGEAAESGTAAGPSVTDDPSARAASGGEGIAAYQLNALLGGIPILRGVSTSVGTTDEGYTSTSVRYQVTDRLTAKATYEQRSGQGDSSPTGESGTASDGGIESRTKLSVDWRFYRDWLLRGSIGVGDGASSGLDLFWQYRY